MHKLSLNVMRSVTPSQWRTSRRRYSNYRVLQIYSRNFLSSLN